MSHDEKFPGPPLEESGAPASQALLDLEASGLTAEDMAAAAAQAAQAAAEAEKNPPNPSRPPRGRWFFLLLLAAAGSLALVWAGETPARLWLSGAAALNLLLLLASALPSSRLLPGLQNRGGLAALLFSGALFIAVSGAPASFPPAVWGFLASLWALVIIWTMAAILRRLGRRPAAVLPVLISLYALSGPAGTLADLYFSPAALTMAAFNASPPALTLHLPWPAWPMALALGLTPLLAALLALRDQFAVLRRPPRHGGDFFLALAFLGLLPAGFLLFSPAHEDYPAALKALTALAPGLAGEEPAAPPALSLENQPTPAPKAPTAPPEQASPEQASPEQAPPEQANPEQANPERPAPEFTPPERTLPEDVPPEKTLAAPEKTSPEPPAAAPAETLAERLTEAENRASRLEERLRELSERLDRLEGAARPPASGQTAPDTPLPPLSAPEENPPAPPADDAWSGGSAT